MTLADSYTAAQAITKERAKNFYYGIRLLPKEKRESLCAVYAFFRESDDLSDDDAIDNKAERLSRWRDLVRQRPTHFEEGSILPAFYDSLDKYQIPSRYFEELLDGTTSDLTVTRYQTFDDLYGYCYKVASTVGLVCLHVFGFDGSQEALEQAEARGIAFQLTNILRDLKEDAMRDRCYLPQAELRQFGYGQADLKRGLRNQSFTSLMKFQIVPIRILTTNDHITFLLEKLIEPRVGTPAGR